MARRSKRLQEQQQPSTPKLLNRFASAVSPLLGRTDQPSTTSVFSSFTARQSDPPYQVPEIQEARLPHHYMLVRCIIPWNIPGYTDLSEPEYCSTGIFQPSEIFQPPIIISIKTIACD